VIYPSHRQSTPGQRVPVVSVIEPPAPFVTVQDVKDYQIIEHSQWDSTRIPLALNAAMAMIDGPRGWLGRALNPQTLELATQAYSRHGWLHCVAPMAIDLPCPPVIELVSVEYDKDGDTTTLDASAYRLERGAVRFLSGVPAHDELRIRYRAGYLPVGSSSPQEDPKEIVTARMAALLLAGDFLRNTEASVPQRPGIMENPAVENLLAHLKISVIA
jgi:hypothetical protein